MRVNCRFYESRTYATGDTVRQCRLDLAPEAPWRCPEDCPKFQPKLNDGGWTQGSLANKGMTDEPTLDADHVSMLDAAENIINAAGPEIVQEVRAKKNAEARKRKPRRWYWPFGG